jgi:hypothetical protein
VVHKRKAATNVGGFDEKSTKKSLSLFVWPYKKELSFRKFRTHMIVFFYAQIVGLTTTDLKGLSLHPPGLDVYSDHPEP